MTSISAEKWAKYTHQRLIYILFMPKRTSSEFQYYININKLCIGASCFTVSSYLFSSRCRRAARIKGSLRAWLRINRFSYCKIWGSLEEPSYAPGEGQLIVGNSTGSYPTLLSTAFVSEDAAWIWLPLNPHLLCRA